MRMKSPDLVVTVLIATLNIILALFPNHPSALGVILAMPLVFVLPGYTLTEVLFHKRSLITSHRLVLSLSLSIAIDIAGGFILNILPSGLQALPWAMFLGLLTITLSLLVAYLRRGMPADEAHAPRLHISVYQGLLFALATTVALLSVLYAANGAVQQPHAGFTQLWMIPAVQTGKSCAVRLGIRSFEPTAVTYRITLETNGTQATPWPSIALAPQQAWQQLLPITPLAANNLYIEARLYRLDKPQTVYRNVHVTLPNLAISKDGKTRQCGIVQSASTRSP
ncbi:MAG: hypothetical protein NVS4B7_03530 [Ktedonobacteraceae bacterium]